MLNASEPLFLYLTEHAPPGLRAWACSCGIGRVLSAGYRFSGDHPAHSGFSIIQLTLAGQGYLDYHGHTYAVPAGHALLVQPPDEHCYYAREGEEWHFAFVTLNGVDAARYWREALALSGPVLKAGPALRRSIEALVANRIDASTASDPWIDGRDAYALCCELLAQAHDHSGAGLDPEAQVMRRVCDHIQRHLADALGVDDLAALAGMSRAHFSRRFKHHTGHAPGAWLQARRLERACHLLRATHDPIATIAMACGFTDGNYFARQFRAHHGLSPRAYRCGD
ncbi:MAG: AraC family transcriptional regulator [Planctomycetota bacterium]|nr:AraC family transcriptional regulator [Planctomycetota bacterium]